MIPAPDPLLAAAVEGAIVTLGGHINRGECAKMLRSAASALDAKGETTGEKLIAAERQRQKQTEGWTPEHDDEHVNGELAQAAAGYAVAWSKDAICPVRWPFERAWWRPSDDRVRNLVKAGALVAAEIDRLLRTGEPAAPPRRRRNRKIRRTSHLPRQREGEKP